MELLFNIRYVTTYLFVLFLSINQNHLWTCSINYPINNHTIQSQQDQQFCKSPSPFDYKFFVGKYDSPTVHELRWEVGPNRCVNLSGYMKSSLEINDVWEYKKVILRVIQNKKSLSDSQILETTDLTSIRKTSHSVSSESSTCSSDSHSSRANPKKHFSPTHSQLKERFYVTADIDCLGNMSKLCKMHKHTYITSGSSDDCTNEKYSTAIATAAPHKFEIVYWEKQFYVKASQQNLKYRYAYKSETHSSDFVERKTHRINFSRNDVNHQGAFAITDQSTFNNFSFDEITSSIFLGPYPENSDQIETLSQRGVKAILNLQTNEDIKSHFTEMELIKKSCAQENIKYLHFPVTDMDIRDMAVKLPLAVYQLERAIRKYQCVYVHCTSGIFRSAQVVIAYLHLHLNFGVNAAISHVESKRPVTKKNRDYLRQIYSVRGGYSTSIKSQSEQSTKLVKSMAIQPVLKSISLVKKNTFDLGCSSIYYNNYNNTTQTSAHYSNNNNYWKEQLAKKIKANAMHQTHKQFKPSQDIQIYSFPTTSLSAEGLRYYIRA